MSTAKPSSELPVGFVGARFEVGDRIGAGGSSVVFRATPLGGPSGVAPPLALKVAHAHTDRGRLGREALLHAWLASPRIPALRDVGWIEVRGDAAVVVEGPTDESRPFLAIDWLAGGRPEPGLESALAFARDVGDALADLHALGFSHGDVKLDNTVSSSAGVWLVDLGLAGPAEATQIEGATLRYLARGDEEIGDGRARDLLALGVCLAELCDATVARSASPIDAARDATLPEPVSSICRALLAPNPTSRPSARWVAATARAALPHPTVAVDSADDRGARVRRVRASYLRVRKEAIARASSATDDAAPWLAEAIHWVQRVRSLDPGILSTSDAPRRGALGPMRPDEIARFVVSLVGAPAAAWPLTALTGVAERDWARGIEALAAERDPATWTVADLERASATSRAPTTTRAAADALAELDGRPLNLDHATELAFAIARVPPSAEALSAVERTPDAPPPLVLAAADALRLAGEHGRALALALRPSVDDHPRAAGIRVDILRRAGDRVAAGKLGRQAIAQGMDADGRVHATLARLELDAGRTDAAAELAGRAPEGPLTSEVRALIALARGERADARTHAAEAAALAATPEEKARAAGIEGHVTHGADPRITAEAYRAAAEHAARAGAIVEEATYRSGEASGAVHVGELDRAIATAQRAALLWEHLGRPGHAARARLAIAAAFATAGAELETIRAAEVAIEMAEAAGDRRAAGFAHWAIADVASAASPVGVEAARAAAALLAPDGEDGLRARARLLRHGVLAVDAMERLDDAATSELTAEARLEWWGARAEDFLARRRTEGMSGGRPDAAIAALCGLVGSPAPISARGPAFAAGYSLASELGQGDAARRLMGALAATAAELSAAATSTLAPAVRRLPWVVTTQARRPDGPPSNVEQARELEDLVRSFGERERLGPLLRRVVDALVLWTGVERGLLLLPAPDGRLVPRAARNLARHDLAGEQLKLSQTLAKRALLAKEPVVAVDAAGELSTMHESVHALKLRSVLAVPLIARGETVGVVYLDDRMRRGAFGEQELAWTRSIATLLAFIIADARDQVLLRRAARRASRLAARLEASLAEREARLEVAERELAGHRGGRATRFRYDHIVGESEPMRALLRTVDRVTAADIPVLIVGQSGSGKELIARAIHDNGHRATRPFVSENCGAIPETLLESTLFGHVRGAFTGADRPRSGLFEVAHQGTLFLDEIGEMSLPMQAKLLRILEDGMVRPLGSERSRKVDTRILAATHRDLAAMVKSHQFREDLLYRLNIITLTIPPLKDRAEDIPLIIERLVDKHGGGRSIRVTRAAMDRLVAYPWPGNVRQLENEVRRTLVLCDGVIDREHLSPEIGQSATASPLDRGLNVRKRVDALEVDLVGEALDKTKGNQTQAAKLLGLSRFGLQKMMKRLGISAER